MEWYWVILLAANIPLYVGLGWLMFDNFGNFIDAVKYWLTPDIISWMRGEHLEDMLAELQLLGWIAMCVLFVFMEHWALQKWVFAAS
jgi:hypothetical protein